MSLEIHLFFARIMKEHLIFLEISFTPKDYGFKQKAAELRKEFDILLNQVVSLSNGVISESALRSEEIITPYTLNAEMVTSYYTGVNIPTDITRTEERLTSGENTTLGYWYEQQIKQINQKAIQLIRLIIQLKSSILSNVLECKMFTNNYPLLIDHITREAEFYLLTTQKLQNRDNFKNQYDLLSQEIFWNQIMAEHSKFIRGLLDPTEEELIQIANDFGKEFDKLTEEAKTAMDYSLYFNNVTDESIHATKSIRDFKAQGTQGLIECKIKSIIVPLLADHTLREANHYLRVLKDMRS
ncbi:DUF2935 domain-containing protein [Anaerosacchariphilus polymeriproducens]